MRLFTYFFLSIFVAVFYAAIALAFFGPRVAEIVFAVGYVLSMFWLLFIAGASIGFERGER